VEKIRFYYIEIDHSMINFAALLRERQNKK